jgi:hypothetical protein
MQRLAHLFTILLVVLLTAAARCAVAGTSEVAPSRTAESLGTAELQPDLRGTQAMPLVVKSFEGPEDSVDKSEQAKYRAIDSGTAQWVMWLTGGMLVVAVGQAWLFFVQLRLMRASMKVAEAAAAATERSVETMEDTARRQLRAYVSVDRAWIEFPEPGVPSVTVIVKNAGQTPAHDLRHWIHQWVEKYPLEVQLPIPPEGFVTSSSLLGAGATHDMWIKHPKPIVKLPFVDEIGTAEATIYVYGEIKYKDIFGNQQFVRYRLMYGGRTKPTPGFLSPCENGNEAS